MPIIVLLMQQVAAIEGDVFQTGKPSKKFSLTMKKPMIRKVLNASNSAKFLRKAGRVVLKTGRIPPTPVGLRKLRSSNTLFILGSGGSINQIENWDLVATHNSVGFNFWMVHPFVPTFYFLEANSQYSNYIKHIRSDYESSLPQLPERLATLARLIEYKAEVYRSVSIFTKQRSGAGAIELLLKRCDLPYRAFVSENFAEPTVQGLADRCKALRSSRLGKNLRFFSQGVASVELNVVIAWQMGYSKVVLCGVDLNDTDYFYYDPRYTHFAERGLVPPNIQVGQTHKTNDPQQAWGGLPIRDVLATYQEHLLKEDCRIYVENSESALAESFPLFPLRRPKTA